MTSGWPYNYRKALNISERLSSFDESGTDLLRPVTDTANLLGYTVYPLLIGKLEAGNLSSRDSPSFATFSQNAEFEVNHDGMAFIAENTGGSIVNKAQFQKLPLTEVAADQTGYYTLGFSTSDLSAGERHEVKVILNGLDYTVRHRKDLRIRTPTEAADLMAQAAVLSGITPDDLDITLGESQKQRGGKLLIPFTLTIPMDWPDLQRSGEKYQAKFTLRVTAQDKSGNQADLVHAPIELSGGKPRPGTTATYDASILVRKKSQRFVFLLQDDLGGTTKSTTVDFKP